MDMSNGNGSPSFRAQSAGLTRTQDDDSNQSSLVEMSNTSGGSPFDSRLMADDRKSEGSFGKESQPPKMKKARKNPKKRATFLNTGTSANERSQERREGHRSGNNLNSKKYEGFRRMETATIRHEKKPNLTATNILYPSF
ncbi:hypothetical protein OSTOST_04838 [Ostertagia ostertagi]